MGMVCGHMAVGTCDTCDGEMRWIQSVERLDVQHREQSVSGPVLWGAERVSLEGGISRGERLIDY